MNTPLSVRDSIGLAVSIAAVIALLTQLQILRILPAIIGVIDPVLLTWHRRAGWIALSGFVFNRALGLLGGAYPIFPVGARSFAHSILSVLCAIAVLSRIRIIQRSGRWRMARVLPWWLTALVFGAGFATLTCTLVGWRWASPAVAQGEDTWLIYQVAVLAHVGLAIALIWLGRLVLRSPGAESAVQRQ